MTLLIYPRGQTTQKETKLKYHIDRTKSTWIGMRKRGKVREKERLALLCESINRAGSQHFAKYFWRK